MYKVGDKFALKCSHGVLRKGETVEVLKVDECADGHYWMLVMSTKRYSYVAWINVCDGEEQYTV